MGIFQEFLPLEYPNIVLLRQCRYNTELKRKVAKIIGISWKEYKEYKKPDWKHIILNNKECYDAAISFYKGLTGVAYDFGTHHQFSHNHGQ